MVDAKEKRQRALGREKKVPEARVAERNREEATKTDLHSGWLGVLVYERFKRTEKEGARGSSPRIKFRFL